MNIIDTDILTTAHDAFWNNIDAQTAGMGPRPVLVVIQQYDAASPEGITLQKMLAACALLPEHYNIVQVGDAPIAWYKLKHQLQPKVVYLPGVLPRQLGVSVQLLLHEPNRYDETIWLPALPIAQLEQNAEAKRQLWVAGMTPIFKEKMFGEIV